MEWNIALLGSVGSGKTTAVQSVSDIDVVGTDAVATDETALLKPTTTVAMDMGVMDLGNGDKLRLHGSPGQDRFSFMWDILLQQARGAIVFVDHSRPDPIGDMRFYLDAVQQRTQLREFPIVLGITHMDVDQGATLEPYRQHFAHVSCPCSICHPPILKVDARSRKDVSALLIVLTASLEMMQRYPDQTLHRLLGGAKAA